MSLSFFRYITKIDKATFMNKIRLSNNPEQGRLEDIFVYDSSQPTPPGMSDFFLFGFFSVWCSESIVVFIYSAKIKDTHHIFLSSYSELA